jgi:hypothetical protein
VVIVPIIQDIMALDADEDGFDNGTELRAGTGPGDDSAFPSTGGCSGTSINPRWDVCGYDYDYVFKKISLDFCGVTPRFLEQRNFRALPSDSKGLALDETLSRCLDSDYWQGRDGVLWRMAHPKVRPLAAIKSGPGAGPVPLGDYEDDYALFVYTQTDDRDAREVLTADYYVTLSGTPPTYQVSAQRPGQTLIEDRRVGMISSRWFFVINTMFTPVPRTTAAQAYRSYLGLDIAKSEGLIPPDGQVLVDYDDKGITDPACAVCHTTLDPLSYPFSRYDGISGLGSGRYNFARMTEFNPAIEGPDVGLVPEAGSLFGEPVQDLVEWADVAANSDQFAQATVSEYWRILVGGTPNQDQAQEFESLWQDFKGLHNYRIEAMLRALIKTEAYGVP